MNLYLQRGNEKFDVTKIITEFGYKDDLDNLAVEENFKIGYCKNGYYPDFEIETGDILSVFYENEEKIRSIVTKKCYEGINISYTAFDFAYFLNKSKKVMQFNSICADDAIKRICKECGVGIGKIASMPKKISKIFNCEFARMIEEIIELVSIENGKKYILEMDKTMLNIIEYPQEPLHVRYKPAFNVASIDIAKNAFNIQRSENIENLRNSITFVKKNGDEESYSVVSQKSNRESIEKFGLLQEVIEIDDKEMTPTVLIAEKKLKELDKIEKTISCTFFGSFEIKKGRLIHLVEDELNIDKLYRIKNSNHTFSNGIHLVESELMEVE